MNQHHPSGPRLHDLDALRAAAMIIGIVYHLSLSFAAGFPWMVRDAAQEEWPFVFQAWVHGFRMQLFMLVAGYFTAMLWRRKGLKELLRHRCKRVLIPCLVGLVTVVPAVLGASFLASRLANNPAVTTPATADVWSAIRRGDGAALEEHLRHAGAVTNRHPEYGITPLTWAALIGSRDLAQMLLDRGAGVWDQNRDGGTALHAAAFMGNAEVAELLLQRGADVQAANQTGERPIQSAQQPFAAVEFIAGMLSIPVERARVEAGRVRVIEQLRAKGANDVVSEGVSAGTIYRWLTEAPVFGVLWFLWMLVWLVGLFAVYAVVMDRVGWKGRPLRLVLSRVRLLWLVPLTMVPTALMEHDLGIGPDTAMGVLPMPHMLLYYAIFFFFGAVYHDCHDGEGRLGAGWGVTLSVTILVVFPLALEFATGRFGFRDVLLPARFHRASSVFLQAVYPWAMAFGCIGLFRALLTRESPVVRYLSDASYWMYLAHLPLCIVGQGLVQNWPGPALLKLPLLSLVLIVILLLSYHFLVRHTWVGRMLNGPRRQTAPTPT
jgi:peptidoglycan/LPS O-acetylase OafA/YrhL